MILPEFFRNHYSIVDSWFLTKDSSRFYINSTLDRGFMTLEVYHDGGEGEIKFFDTYREARAYLKENFKISGRMRRVENKK